MKHQDKPRYDNVVTINGKINEGIEIDPMTGREYSRQLSKEDTPPTMEPGDEFWVYIAESLSAAILPQGTFPWPSEARRVLAGLGLYGICDPDNQALAIDIASSFFAGLAEGHQTNFRKRPSG